MSYVDFQALTLLYPEKTPHQAISEPKYPNKKNPAFLEDAFGYIIYCPLAAALPATAPLLKAYCRLNPPQGPTTSSVSPVRIQVFHPARLQRLRVNLIYRNTTRGDLAVLKIPHTLHRKTGILQHFNQPIKGSVIHLTQRSILRQVCIFKKDQGNFRRKKAPRNTRTGMELVRCCASKRSNSS